MDSFFVTAACTLAGFMAANVATVFFTHWLRAVLSAFGKGPGSAPHRTDLIAAVMTTLLHPVPWMLLIGAWFGIRRLILGPTVPEGWRWFWLGVGGWAVFLSVFLTKMMRGVAKAKRTEKSWTSAAPLKQDAAGLFTRGRSRRFNAALAITLAAYTYQTMTASKRDEVDRQVYKNLDGQILGFSKIQFQRMWSASLMAAWRAFAMKELDIAPAIEGETWNLPKARRMWGMAGAGPFKLYRNYQPRDAATAQAHLYLKAKGVDASSLGV
jgi:hypothetical protein